MEFSLGVNKKNISVNENEIYDSVVLGGGPAGLNAALYAKRKGLNVAIIGKRLGGAVMDTSSVENYMGFENLTGEELSNNFVKHVMSLEIPVLEEDEVIEVVKKDMVEIKTTSGKTVKTKSAIITTGSKPRKLGITGEDEFLGRGVAYCAICDGPLFTGLEVIVAGGGNSAVEAAIDMSKIASKVKLVHRSQFRADKILVDKLLTLDNVEIYLDTKLTEVSGDFMMDHVKAINKDGNEIKIEAQGLFVEIGYNPNSEIFKGLVEMNGRNEILVNSKCETSVPGIYAAGDVTDVPYKQIIISAGEGAKAALSVNDYVNKL